MGCTYHVCNKVVECVINCVLVNTEQVADPDIEGNSHCLLYTVHISVECTLYTVYYTLYSVSYTLYTYTVSLAHTNLHPDQHVL